MGSPIAGVRADVWLSGSPSLNTTNEACVDSGDHTTYTASVHTFWDENQTLTVQCSPNGTTGWATVTDYVFVWCTGQIVFNTARVVSTNNFARISTGYYFNITQVDASYKYTFTPNAKLAPVTAFQASGAWDQYITLTKGGSGTIEAYRNDNRVHAELIANNLVMLQLYIDKTAGTRFQFAARLSQIAPMSDVGAVQTQKYAFTVHRDIAFLLS